MRDLRDQGLHSRTARAGLGPGGDAGLRAGTVSAAQDWKHGLHLLSGLRACVPARQCWDPEPGAGKRVADRSAAVGIWIFFAAKRSGGADYRVYVWRAAECIRYGEPRLCGRKLARSGATREPRGSGAGIDFRVLPDGGTDTAAGDRDVVEPGMGRSSTGGVAARTPVHV